MIVLVISLPIYVSTAYAVDVEIETIEFHDDNNVKNYVNANSGTMTVEATFSNPIQPDQVEYVEDGGFLDFIPDRFQTCESNKCILVKEYAAKSPGKYTAKLKLNIPGISQEKTAQFCADGQGPDVEILDWGQSKNDLIIIFEADDKKTALGGCLGQAIKEAYLYVNNEAVDKIEFDAINNVEKSSFKIDATQYGGITNKLKICVEVRDVLGNSGLGCKKEYVKLDFDTPVILEESLIVTDENGNVMNFIMGGSEPSTSGDAVTSGETDTNNGGDAITSDVGTEEDTPAQEETNEESEEPGDLAGAAIGNVNTEQSGSSINFDSTTFAQIKINISDTSLKQSKVYGDFSVLNFGKQSSYTKRAPDSCEYFIGDKISECIWKDIIYDGKSEELTVRFHAEDEAGNYDDLETVLPLKPISTEPIITGIYFITKEQQSEKVYLSGIENVWPKPYGYDIAVVVSHPVAFNINKDLQLKFPSELFKDATKKTSGCVELSTGTWECYFNSTKPKLVNGEGEIKVVKSSENDMGIKIDKHNSILSLNVTLDSEAPLIAKGMDIESGAVEKNIIKSDLCPTANGNLKLDFRVGEKNLFKVEATYPEEEAISSDELTIGTCGEAENGIQDCQIIISNILPIPLKDGPILINMTDLAGNYNVVPTTTDVCMPETEVTPDFITTITVDASVNSNSVPSIDKKTLSLTDFPIMLTLKYVLKNKRVRVHSQTITCQEAKNIKFVGEESSINPEEEDNKKDVYFMIKKQTLSENDPNVDPEADQNIDPDVLNLKCKSTMHIQFGDKVFDKFEIEEFDVEIPLYGLAMGDASESVQKQLAKIDKDIKKYQKDIDKWGNDFINKLEIACSYAKAAGVINGIVQSMKGVIGGICIATQWWPPMKIVWTTVCGLADYMHGIINQYVWPITSVPIPPYYGHIVKWICIILSCKILDPDFLSDIGTEVANIAVVQPMAIDQMKNFKPEMKYGDTLAGAETGYGAPEPPDQHEYPKQEDMDTLGADPNNAHYKESKAKWEAYNAEVTEYHQGIVKTTGETQKMMSQAKERGSVWGMKGYAKHTTPQLHDTTEVMGAIYKTTADLPSIIGAVGSLGGKWYGEDWKDWDWGGGENEDWDPDKDVEDYMWNNADYDKLGDFGKVALNPELMNPLRMEMLAWTCPHAMEMKYKKLKELKCIQKRCINLAVVAGFPVSTCTKLHSTQKCLYVKSASVEMLGEGKVIGALLANTVMQLMYKLTVLAALAAAYIVPCYPYYAPTAAEFCTYPIGYGGPRSIYCGLAGTALSGMELYNVFKSGEYLDKSLEKFKPSPSYCNEFDY